MPQECMYLTRAEKDALVTLGYTVVSGPYATEHECDVACGGGFITLSCCPGKLLPQTLYSITESNCPSWNGISLEFNWNGSFYSADPLTMPTGVETPPTNTITMQLFCIGDTFTAGALYDYCPPWGFSSINTGIKVCDPFSIGMNFNFTGGGCTECGGGTFVIFHLTE